MPSHAATHAAKVGQVEPFQYWTTGLASFLCRAHRVKVVGLKRFAASLSTDVLGRLQEDHWDAKAAEFADGYRLIVYKEDGKPSRIVWSIVHELGHILLGHRGAAFDLVGGAYVDSPAWCEDEANLFTRNVLLPADEMLSYRTRGLVPAQIASAKGISVSAVNIRLRTMVKDGQFDGWSREA